MSASLLPCFRAALQLDAPLEQEQRGIGLVSALNFRHRLRSGFRAFDPCAPGIGSDPVRDFFRSSSFDFFPLPSIA